MKLIVRDHNLYTIIFYGITLFSYWRILMLFNSVRKKDQMFSKQSETRM